MFIATKLGRELEGDHEIAEYLACCPDFAEIGEFFGITKKQMIRWYKGTYLRATSEKLTPSQRNHVRHSI